MIHVLEQLRQQQIATGGIVDVFPQDNAASLADVNATGSVVVGSVSTVAVSSTEFYDGIYSITGVSSSAFGYVKVLFPVISGKSYTISIWAKKGIGTTSGIDYVGLINSSNQTFTAKTWNEYTRVVVATGTGNGEIQLFNSWSGISGDTCFWDKITIIETD